jgi:hypothetical protein
MKLGVPRDLCFADQRNPQAGRTLKNEMVLVCEGYKTIVIVVRRPFLDKTPAQAATTLHDILLQYLAIDTSAETVTVLLRRMDRG